MQKISVKKSHAKKSATNFPEQISFLKNLIDTNANQQWATDRLKKDGPPHKKLQNALLMVSLNTFVKSIEHTFHTKFEVQKGFTLTGYDEEADWEFPVTLPNEALKGKEGINKILKRFAEGPIHETLMYATVLQVLAWANKTIKK